MPSPGPVKISHKKDGCRRQPHGFHVSQPPPPYPAAGSATDPLPPPIPLQTFSLCSSYINPQVGSSPSTEWPSCKGCKGVFVYSLHQSFTAETNKRRTHVALLINVKVYKIL